MEIIIAEAVKNTSVNGMELLHVKELPISNRKFVAFQEVLKDPTIQYVLQLTEYLFHYLDVNQPLILATDWTDPTEIVGFVLERNGQQYQYPNISGIAFLTDWDNIHHCGIQEIFAHELSHVWMHVLGYDETLSESNTFHTVTSITDPILAFFEGFAEHLELVFYEQTNSKKIIPIYDNGLDINAWISYRDTYLRLEAVKQNRFIYHAKQEIIEDLPYPDLHMLHITSSCVSPEHLKNGNQILSSEGAIASFFYHLYKEKENLEQQHYDFDQLFQITESDLHPTTRLYVNIFHILATIDLSSPTVMVDFIIAYADTFKEDKEFIYKLFLEVTSYVTVNEQYKHYFEQLYLVGRTGVIESFKEQLLQTRAVKEQVLEDVLKDSSILRQGLCPDIWVTATKQIREVPWIQKLSPLRININTATEIDFLALEHVSLDVAHQLTHIRSKNSGFHSLEQFEQILDSILNKSR